MKAPKSVALPWWQRGIADGKVCAHKRRGRYFQVYLESAIAALEPGSMLGVFECVYRCAFRYGYDAEQARRERENTYLPRPRRQRTLEKR